MKGLNFSKFKKIHSDHRVTTLRHPDGHEFRVSRKTLSPKLLEELDRLPMAEGGTVPEKTKGEKDLAVVHEDLERLKTKTKGGTRGNTALDKEDPSLEFETAPPKFAEGGETEESSMSDNEKGGSKKEAPVVINVNSGPQQPGQQSPAPAPATEKPSPSIAQRVGQIASYTPLGLGIRAAGAAGQALEGAIPLAGEAVQGFRNSLSGQPLDAPVEPVGTPPATPQGAQPGIAQEEQPTIIGRTTAGMGGMGAADIYKTGMAGIAQEQKAEQMLGHEKLAAADKHAQSLQDMQTKFQAGTAAKMADIDAAIHDFQNQHINPNHFLESKSTIGRVTTAIGLILGGMGAGMTGGENQALKFMNSQIDRDIESQKNEIGKRHTLISAYQKQFDNLGAAEHMARATELGLYATHIDAAAAKAMDPMAKARALQASASLKAQIMPLVQKAQISQMLAAGGSNVDPATFVPHVVPKDHQEAVYKEIERAQDTKHMGDSIKDWFEKATKENTITRRAGGLRGDPGSVLALKQALQPTFKDLEGTVRQAAMDNTFHNVVPERGDTAHRINEKREALHDYLKSKSSAPRAKSFGIDLDKFRSTTTSETNRKETPEGSTGTYQGKPVVFQGGRWVFQSQQKR